MIIRDALSQDVPAIDAVICVAYGEFAPSLEPGGWERMKQSLAAAGFVAGGATLMVAEDGGRVAGSVAYYAPGRSTPAIFPRNWASLRALAVDPRLRSRGIGRRLTEACIERARQDGAEVIGLHTPARPWSWRAASTSRWASPWFQSCPRALACATGCFERRLPSRV